MNDKLLWSSSILASMIGYILYTEFLGPGQIIYLIPAATDSVQIRGYI